MDHHDVEKAHLNTPPTHVQVVQPAEEPWTTQYVLSILVSIFCALVPFSIIGLIHVLAARNSHAVGHNILAEKKRSQAVCWTAWGFAIGLAFIIIYAVIYGITISVALKNIN